MPQTVIRGRQVLDGSIQRADLDTTTVGQAVVAKLVQGANVSLSSTGGDSGTGDVTISVPGGGIGPPGAAGIPAYTTNSAGFTVPVSGSTVNVTVADASWVAVGEVVWVADAAGIGIAAPFRVTAKSGNQLTLLNTF
jgi:hypothetical protein